ncbi:MAG: ABC transporter permease, partial [Acidobacteriaceae bacterium]|nr:ABC transporter permease [Acidobacteriaceae bacterium]
MLLHDLRYALGCMRREPLLTATIILTLALGIGLNLSIFIVVDGLMFRARVDKDPQRFVHLSPVYRFASGYKQSDIGMPWAISALDYKAYSANARTLQQLAAWDTVHGTLERDQGDQVLAMLVTCNFFSVYGLDRVPRGRLFSPAECSQPGGAPVVLLSEEIWRDRFGADPGILGKHIRFNRIPFTVIGLVPQGFLGRLRGPGIWFPYTMQPAFYHGRSFFQDSTRWLTAEGRLTPGAAREDAQAELSVLASRQDAFEPGRQTTMVLTNGSFGEEPSMRGALFWIGPLIMGALTLILVIACLNVVVLQLSRSLSRRREMAVRISLGAGRARLVRMLLTEMFLLASVSSALSAIVAFRAPALLLKTLGAP